MSIVIGVCPAELPPAKRFKCSKDISFWLVILVMADVKIESKRLALFNGLLVLLVMFMERLDCEGVVSTFG